MQVSHDTLLEELAYYKQTQTWTELAYRLQITFVVFRYFNKAGPCACRGFDITVPSRAWFQFGCRAICLKGQLHGWSFHWTEIHWNYITWIHRDYFYWEQMNNTAIHQLCSVRWHHNYRRQTNLYTNLHTYRWSIHLKSEKRDGKWIPGAAACMWTWKPSLVPLFLCYISIVPEVGLTWIKHAPAL